MQGMLGREAVVSILLRVCEDWTEADDATLSHVAYPMRSCSCSLSRIMQQKIALDTLDLVRIIAFDTYWVSFDTC